MEVGFSSKVLGGRGWGGKKAGLWLGYDDCVDRGLLRSFTSPAQRGRSDAVAAGRGWSDPRPDRQGLSPTLSESGERQTSFVHLSC